ncbi:MAG: T9SS type A sorting domain-containing protein [Bacteroidales bacterium]|nr:T9SS type A sorting domain-containing protein [Bacteroidales bacterium]
MLSGFSFGQGIIIKSGTKVIERSGNMILSRNWVNNGTFTDTGGTVTFAGTTQSLGGSSTATFNNITVSSGSTTKILTAGQKLAGILLGNGTLNVDGYLTLISTASSTALINGAGTGQVSGNVTMERYLPSGFGYEYFSSPFQAATINEFGDDIDLSASFTTFYQYDESRTSLGWVNYKSTTNVLSPMAGYAVNFGSVNIPNTVDVTSIVNNGNLSDTLYNNNKAYTKGFNLIGDAYPSPIDWYSSSGWTKINIDDAFYYFKTSASDQYGGNYSTFMKGISSDGIASNIIPTMQGFFVHVKDGTYPVTGILRMNNNVRVTNQSQSFLKGEKGISLLRFTASFSNNLSSPDYLVVYFDPKATSEFDGQLDALKLMNTDLSVPNVYVVTPNDRKISIKALPYATDTTYSVPLGLKINIAGDVIFKIRDIEGTFSEMRISLIDKVTSTEQDLLNNQEYKISLSVGEYKNRFFLNLSNSITDIPDNFPGPDLFSIYYSQGVLKAKINNLQGAEGADGSIMIYNLLGQTLFIHKIYEEGYHEFNIYLKDGIYIANFISGKNKIAKKILIKNQ